MNTADVLESFRLHGHVAYEGEGVTQLIHAWQCAQLAAQAQATPALQLAAWLHDVGHLLTGLEGSPTLAGIDDAHEDLGGRLLTDTFGLAVGAPVALHVRAKRCLVTRHPAYAAKLSSDSQRSLALQGGPLTPEQCEAFEALPFAADALRLRVWDDLAKRADWQPASPQQALRELAALMDEVRARG